MELTNEQWTRLEPLIPSPQRKHDGRGRPRKNPRDVLNGILWVLRTGAPPWKDLPPRYPPHQTCHRWFQTWVRFLEEPVQVGSVEALLEVSRKALSPSPRGRSCLRGPLNLAATLAVDVTVPDFLIQEMNQAWFGRFVEFVEHDWEIRDGHISVSDQPGLGLEVKESGIARLPYEPLPYRQYRHEDGSWKGW